MLSYCLYREVSILNYGDCVAVCSSFLLSIGGFPSGFMLTCRIGVFNLSCAHHMPVSRLRFW